MTVAFRPDPTVWDGRYANNAWLQECPKPLTKQVWSNAASLAPEDARRLGLEEGDLLRLERDGRLVSAPVIVQRGQAPGVIGLTLGYGRTWAGAVGSGLGADAYRLRPHGSAWSTADIAFAPAGARNDIVRTQLHFELEGREQILPQMTLADLAKEAGDLPPPVPPASLYPPFAYKGYAWAMVIDTTLCIGCNTCLLACQSENNIPVIGPLEVARGRLMHWLRIDTYELGGEGDPRPGFQPVPCMHCEQAPCEPVCPVEASVHDHEGLNVQVYNRCVGTRFCESNCPYKVRRFNFFAYNNGQEFANLGEEPVPAQHNPEVTVRSRGVMEKCTYCVQRISGARRTAEKENRTIREGEVVTACAAACPTQAISFGDLNQHDSTINKLRQEPQHFAMLEHLGTRPRTTYLARVRNPNPELEGGAA
jgi:molybdopterin-containing oxidoreductase family iron-sulfur binding subunit